MVSIVIPVLNNLPLTKQCLEAVKQNTDYPHEVIVVDNGSRPRTAEYLAHNPLIDNLIRNEENVGFGKAVNQGWAVASGDYLMTINNDTIPGPGWLEPLVETLAGDIRIGITGKFGGFVNPDYQCVYLEPETCRDCDYIEGSCLIMSRWIYNTVGGFADMFAPAYCEDTDLSIRIRKKGFGVYCRPDIDFKHLGGQTTQQELAKEFQELLNRNHELLKKLYGPCESVMQTHFPITLVYEATDRGPMYGFPAAMETGKVSIPLTRWIKWADKRKGPISDLSSIKTDWVLIQKKGEKLSQQLLSAIPDMLMEKRQDNAMVVRDAWGIQVPGNEKQVRLFRKSRVDWSAEKQCVMETKSCVVGDYRGEGITNV